MYPIGSMYPIGTLGSDPRLLTLTLTLTLTLHLTLTLTLTLSLTLPLSCLAQCAAPPQHPPRPITPRPTPGDPERMVDARHAHRAAVHTAREGGAGAHRLSLVGQGRCARQAGSALKAAPSRPRPQGRAAARHPCLARPNHKKWGCPALPASGWRSALLRSDRAAQGPMRGPMRGRSTAAGQPSQPVADSETRNT